MGREIRRVPPNWEHPRKEDGRFKSLLNQDYESASEQWIRGFMAWEKGDDANRGKASCSYYWEWNGGPPDKDDHRPKWEQEPTHYQIYETVSEGTPVSPVFETLGDLVAWLKGQGYSDKAAMEFTKLGHACTMVLIPGKGIYQNIHALDIPEREKED